MFRFVGVKGGGRARRRCVERTHRHRTRRERRAGRARGRSESRERELQPLPQPSGLAFPTMALQMEPNGGVAARRACAPEEEREREAQCEAIRKARLRCAVVELCGVQRRGLGLSIFRALRRDEGMHDGASFDEGGCRERGGDRAAARRTGWRISRRRHRPTRPSPGGVVPCGDQMNAGMAFGKAPKERVPGHARRGETPPVVFMCIISGPPFSTSDAESDDSAWLAHASSRLPVAWGRYPTEDDRPCT